MYQDKYIKYKSKYFTIVGQGINSEKINIKINPIDLDLVLNRDTTVSELKNLIKHRYLDNLSSNNQIILTIDGSILSDNNSLASYQINSNLTIDLVIDNITRNPNDIFTIYTTGITNMADNSETLDNIVNQWVNNNILDNLIKYIPEIFQIEVKHYDPMELEGNNLWKQNSEYLKEYRENRINNELLVNDVKHPRVISSDFYQDWFPTSISLERPSVVIDFARIFQQVAIVGVVSENTRLISLNVISMFPGTLFHSDSLRKSKLLQVSPTGQVITFIDRMIELGLYRKRDGTIDPIGFLKRYCQSRDESKLRRLLENKYRDQDGLDIGSLESRNKIKNNKLMIEFKKQYLKKTNCVFNCLWKKNNINKFLRCLNR